MRVISTSIPGLLVLEPQAHRDHRGFFLESWRDDWMKSLGTNERFIQDNHARSEEKGVLRGLHFQSPPHAQAKLVWVTRGSVYDVAVDIRKGSPTYGKFHGVVLSAENFLRFYVPRGFAHGYMTLEEGTEVHYKVDGYYAPDAEGGVRWNDPALGVPWPGERPVLSAKDEAQPLFADLESPFLYGEK